MLQPKKVKYRLAMRGVIKGNSTRGYFLSFGEYGLKSLEGAWVSARQIEAARKTISAFTQKGGKIWIRIFPDKPVTAKGNEIPMGGGKGSLDRFVRNVKPGTLLFEIDGVTKEIAKEALRLAAYKLPVKSKIISKK